MPSASPLVTVVIPAYNAATHLPATLESVRGQTCQSFEIIVVNDGSRDDTRAVAEAAAVTDPRIRVVHQDNAGVGAARNTGLHLARGRYIAPLDADDLWSPRKLERQIARLEQAGPQYGMAYCWSRHVDEQNRVLRWAYPFRIEGRVGSGMLLGNFIGSASVPMFRAAALATVGRYLTRTEQQGAQGCEDWDLALRLAERFSVCCVAEYLVSYRQRDASMSLDFRGMAKSYEFAMRRAVMRNSRLPSTVLAWSTSRFYSYLASKCYGWSDYAGTLSCLGRVLRVDPVAWINVRNYRLATLALLHLVSGGHLRRHRAPPPVTAAADALFQQSPPVLSPALDLFTRIHERRLEDALHTHPRAPRIRTRPRSALGY